MQPFGPGWAENCFLIHPHKMLSGIVLEPTGVKDLASHFSPVPCLARLLRFVS